MFIANCSRSSMSSTSVWTIFCLCEDKSLNDDLQLKMSNVNGSSSAGLQFLMQELIKGSSVFTNKRVVIHSLFLILNEIKRRYSPITKDNDIDVVILCEALYNSIRDLNTRKPLKGEAYNSYCGVLGEVEQNKKTFQLTNNLRSYLNTAPRNSKAFDMSRHIVFLQRRDNVVSRNAVFLMAKYKSWYISAVRLSVFQIGKNESKKDIMRNNTTPGNCSKEFVHGTINQSTNKITRTISTQPVLSKTQIYLELSLMILGTAAMSVAIVILKRVKVRSQRNAEKLYVHRSLMISRILANMVYMADVFFTKRNEYRILCTVLVVVQHYFHTAVFSWMLCEGLHLYFMLVKVLVVTKLYLIHSIIGWGLPVVVLVFTAAIQPSTYNMSTKHEVYQCGTQEIEIIVERNFCWLNGGFWIYNGPILGILLVNFALFLVFLNIAYGKLSQRFADNKLKKARKCIKCVAALLPLLGLVWLFGYTVNLHWILAYIFIIINSSQGIMIAIFHCLLDDKVKATLKSNHKGRKCIKNEEMVVQGNENPQFQEKEENDGQGNKEADTKKQQNDGIQEIQEVENDGTGPVKTQEILLNDVFESKL